MIMLSSRTTLEKEFQGFWQATSELFHPELINDIKTFLPVFRLIII